MQKAEATQTGLRALSLQHPFKWEGLQGRAYELDLLVDLGTSRARAKGTMSSSLFHSVLLVITEIYLRCQVETTIPASNCQSILLPPPGEPLRPGGLHRRPRPRKLQRHQAARRSRNRLLRQTQRSPTRH